MWIYPLQSLQLKRSPHALKYLQVFFAQLLPVSVILRRPFLLDINGRIPNKSQKHGA